MVTNVAKKSVLAVLVLIVVLLVLSIFGPTVADKGGENRIGIVLKSAISSYRDAHGRAR